MFLDCVYQIMTQFPLAFEFNLKYLKKITVHAFTLKFGTFLCDNEKEREVLNLKQNTVSLWGCLEKRKEKYSNALYNKEKTKGCLFVDPLVVRNSVWTALYSRWIASEISSLKEYPCEV
eukprot:TRINITY_DN12232_c0_g1_i3.p1 TRINITY_DN12232_c0_g1~~TRINITY_DN12232_c0_g1_i3.p1  ORF type:complete len:119 (-),score=30.46 TRINITY_DN12232_c0_g1_i3:268-624(-)